MKSFLVLFSVFIMVSFMFTTVYADEHKRKWHDGKKLKIEKNHDDDNDHDDEAGSGEKKDEDEDFKNNAQLNKSHDDDHDDEAGSGEKKDEDSFFSKIYNWIRGLFF